MGRNKESDDLIETEMFGTPKTVGAAVRSLQNMFCIEGLEIRDRWGHPGQVRAAYRINLRRPAGMARDIVADSMRRLQAAGAA